MKYTRPHKEGAALVIALGFLAILTVMIVAFMVQSRSERLAGRAYLNNAQAKQMLHTALARAMEDIDSTFGTNYPHLLALGSRGNTGLPMAGSIDFSTERDYIPLGNTAISDAFEAELRSTTWEQVMVDGTNVGRIAYVIVNTSGLLDANAVGSTHINQRKFGLSPDEIQLNSDILPELNASGKMVNTNGALSDAVDSNLAFVHNRDTAWRRFETLRDLKVLNGPGRGSVLSGNISSFNVFSHYPQSPFQGLELTETIDEDEFTKILTEACGFNPEEAKNIIDNYYDYIDADSIPTNLLSSSVEAVPMVNEIWMKEISFTQDATDQTNVQYEIYGELYVETWYPFDTGQPTATNLQLYASNPTEDAETGTNTGPRSVEIIVGEDNMGANDYITVMAFYTNAPAKAFILELVPKEGSGQIDGPFATYGFEFGYVKKVKLQIPFTNTDDEDIPVPYRITFTQDAIEVAEKVPLDRVEHIIFDTPFSENGSLSDIGAMCADPRVNYDFSDLDQWMLSDVPTPNAINPIKDWGEEADLGNKDTIRFHVANAPMENAAELGHLSVGTPWRTVRLYGAGEQIDPVLDHFHTGESFRNKNARPGLINPNSHHKDVLASAFLDAPIQTDFDRADIQKTVNTEMARILGANLAASPDSINHITPSHIGNALSDNLPGWTHLTDAQKESIVANSYRLFGNRDTSYTLLLVAQAGTDLTNDGIDDSEVRSSQQAVVQVWRDPVKEKSAIVFFGLTDTLRSSIGSGKTWGDLLIDFKPE